MKIDDVIGGQFTHNGVTYQMVEAKLGNTVVWPLNYTYVITSAIVTYTAGTKLYARGSFAFDGNSAYVTGNVDVYVNGIYVRTLSGVTLTPTLMQGTKYLLDGNYVCGRNLGTDELAEYPEPVTVSYGNASTTVTITQEANVKSVLSREPTGSKHYGQPTTDYSNYRLTFSTDRYGSIATAAPASGANSEALQATLSYVAKHLEVDTTPWTQDAKVIYTYTSRATSEGTEANYYTGSDITRSQDVDDTATISGSATGFTRSGMFVRITSEGTDYHSEGSGANKYGRSVTYTATVQKHDGGTRTEQVTLYQAENIIVSDVLSTPVRQWDGNPYETPSDSDYTLTLTIPQYTSSSSPAPASGATVSVIITADHKHTVTTLRDWYETRYHTYTWSSGASNNSEPFVSATGTDTISTSTTTVTDHPTPIFSVSNEGFSFNSDYTAINIASRGTSYSGSTRSAQVKVINGTQTAVAWVYQAKNGSSTRYVYDLAISISLSTGTIPASGGNYTVAARSYRITRTTYDSGAISDSTPSGRTAQLAKQNCTSSKTTVYGDETFSIEVTPNSSTTDPRIVRLTLTAGGESVVAQAIQDAVPIPTNQVATFLPYIPTTGTDKGKVYYTFRIDSGSLTSATVTGLYFKYQRNGSSTQSVNIGSFSVAQTSSPVLLNVSGIPNFDGSRSVKAWFEVTGSKGGFDTIHANESTYYTYVEFDPYVPPTPEPNT